MTHSWGSKFMAIAFSCIIQTENRFFVSKTHELDFMDRTLNENKENWFSKKIKPSTVDVIIVKMWFHTKKLQSTDYCIPLFLFTEIIL